MLVQFSFKNFGPFCEEAVFDMRAINSYKEHENNIIKACPRYELLKTAMIYGANASGKSQLAKAFSCFIELVHYSYRYEELTFRDGSIKAPDTFGTIFANYQPFAFRESKRDIEFQIICSDTEAEYRYGFSFNDKEVTSEWLYTRKYNTNSKFVMILEKSLESGILLGAKAPKGYKKYCRDIDKSILVLTFFNQLKKQDNVFNKAYDCIRNILVVDSASENFDFRWSNYFDPRKKEDYRPLISFLKAADIKIEDFKPYREDNGQIQIKCGHRGIDDKIYYIDLDDESSGTQKLIGLWVYLNIAYENNGILIFDELDVQLHPLLQKFILNLYHDDDSQCQCQLIFSTHNVFLMDRRFIRRDQVWFVEKDSNGCSHLFSLAEFKQRNDAQYSKNYLEGLFGAVPDLQDFILKPQGRTNGK